MYSQRQSTIRAPRAGRVARVARVAASIPVLILLAGCASVRGPYVWADDLAQTTAVADTAYVIGVGDLINIAVWDNEKLSTHARVRTDGRVSVPLVGEVVAANRAPRAIAAEIERQLKADQVLIAPRVNVTVEEMRPLTVAVLGAVAHSGMIALDRGAGVAEALAGAGGLTEFAHADRIFVVRRAPEPMRIRFTFESLKGESGKASMFRLQPGDVVIAE